MNDMVKEHFTAKPPLYFSDHFNMKEINEHIHAVKDENNPFNSPSKDLMEENKYSAEKKIDKSIEKVN
jgi:hypothetical protein